MYNLDQEMDCKIMKILTLVSATNTRPELDKLKIMEETDQYPRATFFGDSLNSDFLDLWFLDRVPYFRLLIYKRLPVAVAQVLEAYLQRNNYNAIISWSEQLGLSLALLLKVTGKRLPHVAIWSWISKPKKAFLLRLTYSHFDKIILMSSKQYDFVINQLKIPSSKVVLLKWPIDQKFWRPFNINSDMISTVGREMRDFGTLIEALNGLDIKCHIAASAVAGKKDAWQQDLKNIKFDESKITIGKKTFNELRDLYARSRFVVVPLYPTDTDNGTTTILEAMAMGKAVICSRVDGQRDVIQEGKTGLLVPPQDPRSLREAIQYLWNNPKVAEDMGSAGRKHIEQFHTLDNWVNDVKIIVEEAISNHVK
jgi:glycosyltransferase involved in cell wall biosynthesis